MCKGTTENVCRASNECVWVESQQRRSYCRSRGRRRQQGQGQGDAQDLGTLTVRQLRNHPLYRQIRGRSTMNKQALVQALRALTQQQRPWNERCREMEERCPMSTTLTGDVWCDVPESNIIRTVNYDMCFEYSELLRMIHEGFVAVDTSYEIPQLRMKLPRDPYRRLIPKNLIKQLLVKPELFQENVVYISDHQDILYFLLYVDDFYRTFDKPQFTDATVNPINLNRALETWFRKHRRVGGGLKLVRDVQTNAQGNQEYSFEWEFRREPTEYTLINGRLNIYV